jgi:hypothetical protein
LLISSVQIGSGLRISQILGFWILLAHIICPNRKWFETFKSCTDNVRTVLMDNDAKCKVIGIGTIKVRTIDRVVKTLTNVRYVPNVKKNMISLGTLDSLSYNYSAKDRVMEIAKGALVVMKDEKIGICKNYSGTQLLVKLQHPLQHNHIVMTPFCGICSLVI